MLKLSSVRCTFPEKSGFFIDRKIGHRDYTFLHFYNSVDILDKGSIITTAPHAVILYSPGMPQYFRSNEPLIHDWFHFSGNIEDLIKNEFKVNEIYYPNNYNFITKAVAKLENEFFGNKKNSEILIDLEIKGLLLRLERCLAEEDSVFINTQIEEKFRILRGEIFSSLNSSWSVENMAKRVNLSESRYFALYKKIFGITPTADLINAKINSAKNMLRFRNNKVEDIADCLGYENTTHFIRQFKKIVGVTPTEYRAKHK